MQEVGPKFHQAGKEVNVGGEAKEMVWEIVEIV